MAELPTTTLEEDARLIKKDTDINSNGFQLERMWAYIDATVADTLSAAREADSPVINPKADGQTYTGTFVISNVTSQEATSGADDNNQRYVNIIETLVRVASPADVTALATLEPIIEQGNEIITGFSWEDGEEDDLKYTYKNLNPASRDTMMGLSDSSLVTSISGAGWTYIDREFTEEENNTGTFVIFFKKETWLNETGNTPNQTIARTRTVGYGNYDPQNDKSGVDRTRRDRSDGIPIDDLEEVRDNQVADTGYAIRNIQAVDNKDGSGTIETNQVKKRGSSDQFTVRFTSQQGVQPESQTIAWHNLSETVADSVYDNAILYQANMNDSRANPVAPASHVLRSLDKPIEDGVDADGAQMFGVTRVTYKPRVVWLTQLNQQEEIEGWRYEAIRSKTLDGYALDSTIPRVKRTDLKITSSKANARIWADGSSRDPVTEESLGVVQWVEGAGVFRSLKVLISTGYTSATPFVSADAADTWLSSTIPAG